MTLSSLAVQLLNGLASASSLFLVAAGLSLVFGVTRIVNFAHGSLYMVGAYVAYSLVQWTTSNVWGTWFDPSISQALGFWVSVPLTVLVIALLGAAIEYFVLRRIYHVPELFQLLATFALLLIIKDASLWLWGPEELLGPRAPGFEGAVPILGRAFPSYDLFLMVVGPVVLAGLWWVLRHTHWGVSIRAATQDRDMVAALGVHQARLFTSVFALSAALAGLAGALNLPKESVNLDMDLHVIGSVFVVVVVGGLGSVVGAFVAALLISLIKAVCIALGVVNLFGVDIAFPKLTLVIEFLVMAAVLIWRPWGLMGRPIQPAQGHHQNQAPLKRLSTSQVWLLMGMVFVLFVGPTFTTQLAYMHILTMDILLAILFAASLHVMMGPGGLHSFGHAAYFGIGAYVGAMFFKSDVGSMGLALLTAPLAAAMAALLFGAFAVRLSGVYLAMLTLAFAQIVWAVVFQWDAVTGGSNGLIGIWPQAWLADSTVFYFFVLILVSVSVALMWMMIFAPFGLALRAARDHAIRAQSLGVPVVRLQWTVFVVAGAFAGLAGVLYSFAKGSVAPEVLGVGKSIDGLVMVLLGGIQTLVGPIAGAITFVGLQDVMARHAQYWRALLGCLILLLVLLFPTGLAGVDWRQAVSGLSRRVRMWLDPDQSTRTLS